MAPTNAARSSIATEEALPDLQAQDNFVEHILKNTTSRPPITFSNVLSEINYLNLIILTAIPALSVYGACTTELRWETTVWSMLYYLITGLGITAGYHRLWSHRSYNASKPLEYFLAMAGSGAVQGSIKWWSRNHRAHHRYTDTDLDPYDARKGFWWSHVGWMLVKPRIKPGPADVSDLSRTAVVRWQHRWYIYLIVGMGLVFPTAVAWLLWGDARGGFFFAGAARLCFVHHSTFCVNSLAHWLGDTPFDDKHSPKNHFITALVTVGEGYHNFHHQFPVDYRNAIKWYQYDPTKWFIWVCSKVGLASHLKSFPDNEVKKGELTMQLKRLRAEQERITWPEESHSLPVISWQSFQEQSTKRPLVLVTGFIHDVSGFLDEHPGGRHMLAKYMGRDATTAFFGGVYDHSNAAHNLLSMMRVGVLCGGVPHALEEKAVPPSQRLRVARNDELANPYSSPGSSSGYEGEEIL
ncbi:delta 9-fatty acid desaturase protein [Vararia minispora EC-137]|uniref:Delta 9-fatty acid desaturase protein n=1 Tax=Vararia minispora EC-137 TaxID=1314806 RepID=A0ACB8QQP5_9AGAM|nr:delta 9-fatty acid desaturase protein [Vararia minispora EC-137]